MEELKKHIHNFFPFAKERMGFDKPPKLFLKQDAANAQNALGKTAFYDPSNMSITIFVSGRHPKDILRSFSHELVHHAQNCRGEFEGGIASEDGYAQTDMHMREMEREAYEQGNLCFRDWEDSIKYGGGEQTMALNEKKLREAIRAALKKVLSEETLADNPEEAEKAEAAEEEAEKVKPGDEAAAYKGETNEGVASYNRDDDDGDEDKTLEEGEEEELEEGGTANRRENEEKGEERRMKTSSAMRESTEQVPLQEWYQHNLYNKLVKSFTTRK